MKAAIPNLQPLQQPRKLHGQASALDHIPNDGAWFGKHELGVVHRDFADEVL